MSTAFKVIKSKKEKNKILSGLEKLVGHEANGTTSFVEGFLTYRNDETLNELRISFYLKNDKTNTPVAKSNMQILILRDGN